MDNITIEISGTKIREAFEKASADIFKSDYSNPIKDLLTKSIAEKSGEIKKVVDEIIVQAISNPEFKTKIADAVLTSMVASVLKK